jgi:hypothetical protein
MVTPVPQTPPKPAVPVGATPAAPAPQNPQHPQNPAAPGTIHKPAAAAPAATTPAAPGDPAHTGEQTEGEPAKKKKVAKEKTGVPRPRLPKFDETHVITVLRPGAKIRMSGDRYNQYVNGMTVKEYIEKMTAEPWKRTVGQVYADLRWDTDPNRKLINIGPEVVPIPPPPPPKEKKVSAKTTAEAAAEAKPAA